MGKQTNTIAAAQPESPYTLGALPKPQKRSSCAGFGCGLFLLLGGCSLPVAAFVATISFESERVQQQGRTRLQANAIAPSASTQRRDVAARPDANKANADCNTLDNLNGGHIYIAGDNDIYIAEQHRSDYPSALAAAQALDSGDQREQINAARWLTYNATDLSHRDTIAKALDPLLSQSENIQREALMALAKWATRDNTPSLIRVVKQSSARLRYSAIQSLGATGDERAMGILAENLSENSAKQALEKFGPAAADAVAAYHNDPDSVMRYNARLLLNQWPAREAIFRQCVKDLSAGTAIVVRLAADWLANQPVDEQHQAAVAGKLELMVTKRTDLPTELIDAMRKWARAESVPALIHVLENGRVNRHETRKVIEVLKTLKDPLAIPALVNCVIKRTDTEAATDALREMGPAVADAIVIYANHPDHTTRLNVQSLLKELRVPSALMLAQCVKDLKSGDHEHFGPTLQWLKRQPVDDALRMQVAVGLSAAIQVIRKDPTLEKKLMRDWVDAVKVWGTSENTTVLVQLMGQSRLVANAAIDALGRINDPKACTDLVKALADRSKQRAAEQALINLGSAAEDAVIPLLQHADDSVRRSACQILTKIGGQKSISPLREYVSMAAQQKSVVEGTFGKRAMEMVMARLSAPDGPIDRTWTDNTGGFTITATLIEFRAGQVKFQRSDGSTFNLAMGKLSEGDQQYVREELRKRQAAAKRKRP